MSTTTLRQQLLQQRKALSDDTRNAYDQNIADAVIHHPHFQQAQHIACYHAYAGEVGTTIIIDAIFAQQKHCYLPQILADKKMAFTEYTAQSQLKRVKYGIAEVAEPTVIYPTTALDLVITPLVGFDENANRMGWGQGHYDRTFEFLQQRSRPTTPFLLGIAYECQKVEALTTHDWDVPLDMIITEKIIYYGEST